MTKRNQSLLLLFVVSIIWGVVMPIIKYTGETFSPALLLAYRFFISSIIGSIYFYFHRQELKLLFKHPLEILGHTLFTIVLGLGIGFIGFNYTNAITASILTVIGPLFIVMAGVFFLKEKITKHEILGLSLALFGSGIITVPSGNISLGLELLALFGAFCIILSRLFDAIGHVFIKKSLKLNIDPQAITHISFINGFIFFSFVTLLTVPIPTTISTLLNAPLGAHIGVFFIALFSGTIAYSLANTALKHLPIGEAGMFTYISPLWAMPIAVVWLKEPISLKFIVGAVIIAIGVFIAEYHKRKRMKIKTNKRTKRTKG